MADEALLRFWDAGAEVPPPPDEESDRILDCHEITPEELVRDVELRRRPDWTATNRPMLAGRG
jgi:hypothetical protein